MSEKSGGFGSFLFGIAVGAVVGFFFAPEAGEGTRRKVTKGLRNLRELAEEKVDEVRGLLAEGEDEDDDAGQDADDEDDSEPSTRDQLRRRVQAARRRRSPPAPKTPARDREEEDETLA
jgi:gas vesicle protein